MDCASPTSVIKRRSVIDAINELKVIGWLKWDGTCSGSPTNTSNFQFVLKLTGAVERTQPVQRTAHELSLNHLRTIAAHRRGQEK
jgi:hypothetical protein